MTNSPVPRVSTARIFGYALGEGAISITLNGVSNFALLFYTQVAGLGAGHAGLALGITTFWDAIIDPYVGHLSDNTRTRWGRRLPYIVLGGLFLSASYLFLWLVPGGVKSPAALFTWALLANLLLRTAVAFYSIPYTALGFEICPSYEDRSRLQGIRSVFNMAVNLVFGAFAWSLFFGDHTGADGVRVDGTTVAGNYTLMGWVLAVSAAAMVLLCAAATRFAAGDNRGARVQGLTLGAFREDMTGIFRDRLAWLVFGFFAVAQLGIHIVSQAQMFAYVNFMQFPAGVKTMVHGSGMVAFAVGAMLQAWLTRSADKKVAGYAGMAVSMFGGLFLWAVFFGFHLEPGAALAMGGFSLPLGFALFGLGQVFWWGGCGMIVPLAVSMVADLSEINYLRTGVLKDGAYSAVFTLLQKAAMSVGLFTTGWTLERIGIVSGGTEQTAEAARGAALLTFLSGPALLAVSFFILRRYPVNRAFLEDLKSRSPHVRGEGA